MKRFLIIGDRLKDILPNDFTVLWIGEAKNKDDALRKHESIHPPDNYRIHKVIEITREYELPYNGW